jgi:gluconokinase
LRKTAPVIVPGNEAWCYYLAENNWLSGGVLHDAGNVLNWFANNFMANPDADVFAQMNKLADETPPGADGLYFLPYLGGERCPHDRPDATGVIHGLTFAHGRNHMVRAMMEGLAYNLFAVYRMLAPSLGPELVVTGGILKSPVWLKIVANFFNKTLWLPKIQEASAWGGIMLGLKAIGVFSDLAESQNFLEIADKQSPDPNYRAVYSNLLAGYDQLYADVFKQ